MASEQERVLLCGFKGASASMVGDYYEAMGYDITMCNDVRKVFYTLDRYNYSNQKCGKVALSAQAFVVGGLDQVFEWNQEYHCLTVEVWNDGLISITEQMQMPEWVSFLPLERVGSRDILMKSQDSKVVHVEKHMDLNKDEDSRNGFYFSLYG
jgi:hypothetical protein